MSLSPPLDTLSAPPVWHAIPIAEAAKLLDVDPNRGLSSGETERRRQRFGMNLLAHARGRSAWSILLAQFASLMVGLLIAATGVAFLMGEYVEAFDELTRAAAAGDVASVTGPLSTIETAPLMLSGVARNLDDFVARTGFACS